MMDRKVLWLTSAVLKAAERLKDKKEYKNNKK